MTTNQTQYKRAAEEADKPLQVKGGMKKMEKRKLIKNKALEVIAKVRDDNMGCAAAFTRGIGIYPAQYLTDLLIKELPELYLTLHHAEGWQIHPRLRGWSKKPEVSRESGHPDWGDQKDIALFEAHIGKREEYWARESFLGKDFREKPIEERIEEDMEFVKKKILKGIIPCEIIKPYNQVVCRYSGIEPVWCRNGTRVYQLK